MVGIERRSEIMAVAVTWRSYCALQIRKREETRKEKERV